MKPPLVGFLTIFKNRLCIPPLVHAPFKRRLIQTKCHSMAKIDLLAQLAPFGKQSIMHRPILPLYPSTPGGHRGIYPGTLIPPWKIAVDKSNFPRVDITSLNPWPRLFEKFHTIPACEITIFDQGHRCVGLPSDPHVGFR